MNQNIMIIIVVEVLSNQLCDWMDENSW